MTQPFELRHGDSFELLRELEEGSIDSIVTDPPYGLDFMGKEWDHGVPGVELWTQALRVLKPGGYLLAFGGTRTYHRMACAIEDAGFEIRDCLQWLYGSGFPKSLDVSKAIDRGFRRDEVGAEYEWRPTSGAAADVYAVTAFVREARDRTGTTNREIDALFGFHGMSGHWTSKGSQPSVPTWPQWEQLKGLLQFGDAMDELVITLNGGKGDRSIEGTALAEREVLGRARGKDASLGDMYSPGEGTYLAKEYDLTKPATAAARAWAGWGTALKPAYEPIVLARKPLAGTVAANVLAHGTGALNVDGCRVGADGGCKSDAPYVPGGQLGAAFNRGLNDQSSPPVEGLGRWPANIILSHGPECREVGTRQVRSSNFQGHERPGPNTVYGAPSAGPRAPGGYASEDGWETVPAFECAPDCPVRLLDEQADVHGAGHARPSTAGGTFDGSPGWGGIGVGDKGFRYGDGGGASRFFYTAKASSGERHYAGRNAHPTVKPVTLMRWLCRLVTPPGGLVLDPFTGSGSTGIAALAEGFRFIGIERDLESVQTARRRIAGPLFAAADGAEQ